MPDQYIPDNIENVNSENSEDQLDGYLDEKTEVSPSKDKPYFKSSHLERLLIQKAPTLAQDVLSLQKRYSKIIMKGKARIITRAYRGGIELIDSSSFHEFYRYLNEDVQISKKSAQMKRVYAAQEFLDSPVTHHYLGVAFDPSMTSPKVIWNLWEGFKVEPKEGDVALFLELINSLCNDNEQQVEYVLNWLAHMVQKPADLPEVALVLRGEQGVGKGTLMKIIGKFTNHYLHLSSSRPLVGNFNGMLADAYLVFCDESVWGGNKDAEGVLKALITEHEHTINEKNEKEFMIENYKRFIFASNEDWAVPVGVGDRRYMVLDCSPRYKGQYNEGQFFWKVDEAIKNHGLVPAVFHYLQTRDISKFNPRDLVKTTGYIDLMTMGFDPCTRFVYELVSDTAELSADTREMTYKGHESKPVTVPVTRWYRNAFYQDFVQWCDMHNIKHIPTTDSMGKAMNKIFQFTEQSENWRTNWKHATKGSYYNILSVQHAMEKFAQNVCNSPPEQVFAEYGISTTSKYTNPNFHTVQPA